MHPDPAKEPLIFPRFTKVIMVLDVVESVRLMNRDEHGFIQHWHRFVEYARNVVLPAHGGRMHKSLGDGLMLEFGDAGGCVRAAFAFQHWCGEQNALLPQEQQMRLRFGAHLAEFVADEHDIYGTDVNLTARVATLAGPGEIVVTASLRDCLTEGLDANVEDMGECHLKHVREPVQAYRVWPPGQTPPVRLDSSTDESQLRPTVVVVPFTARTAEPTHEVLGEVLAEEIIAALSRCAQVNVISRLSTTAFRYRQDELPRLKGVLDTGSGASFALTGSYRVLGDRITLIAELADLRTSHVVWAESLKSSVQAILAGEDELTPVIVRNASLAVARIEAERASSKPLPTLQSATLHMGAISLMHRAGGSEFEQVREMLESLIDRHPRIAAPRAWLAKWHVLRVTRGLAAGDKATESRAIDLTRRALDCDPQCSLALAIEGFIRCHLTKDLGAAERSYSQAIQVNPNDSLAWLFKGVLHAFRDEGSQALADSRRALGLSPLDPMLYFYQSLTASAAFSAGDYEAALRFAQDAFRLNRSHTSSLRVQTMALAMLGREIEARQSAQQLQLLEPDFSVEKFLRRSPSSSYSIAQVCVRALRAAGIPER